MEWNKTYHRRKICIIFFSVVLMSMVLCGRLVYLMLFEGKYYETQAKDLQQRERKIKAARGKILWNFKEHLLSMTGKNRCFFIVRKGYYGSI